MESSAFDASVSGALVSSAVSFAASFVSATNADPLTLPVSTLAGAFVSLEAELVEPQPRDITVNDAMIAVRPMILPILFIIHALHS